MRFFIGCYEICGLVRTYSEELKRQGHSVTNISDKNSFFNYAYDYSLSNLKYEYFTKNVKNKFLVKSIFKISEFIEKLVSRFRLYIVLILLIRKIDVYIYIWEGFVPDKYLFLLLKIFRKKIVVLFLGDEVRNFTALSQEFDITPWQFPTHYTCKSISESIMKLRYAEKYADVIYSVPDQMGFATRPYNHLHLPIHVAEYYFTNHSRDVPIVIHLPSEPFIKGTDIIGKVLDELKAEGLEFEVIYKSKIPHEEVKLLLSHADILVDEIILHGPGVLSLEAMASGCAVATNYLPENEKVFHPPVCKINYKTIKDNLRVLITNKVFREELILKGHDYVSQYCNPSKIVEGIITDMKRNNQQMEYTPKFYKEKFIQPTQFKSLFEKADKIYFN